MDRYDALILPGGLPTFGTCACMIMFADVIADGIDNDVDDIPEPHRLAERGW